MKKTFTYFFMLFFFVFCSKKAFSYSCIAPLYPITIENTEKLTYQFCVKLAKTSKEKKQGLMFVKHMPETEGMLFLYDIPTFTNFWMRNTLIPLDIIFINEKGKITAIHSSTKPLSENLYRSSQPSQAVLEINGGIVEKLNVQIGDIIHTSSLNYNAP